MRVGRVVLGFMPSASVKLDTSKMAVHAVRDLGVSFRFGGEKLVVKNDVQQ